MQLSRLDMYLIKDAIKEFHEAVMGVRRKVDLKDELEKARGKVKENVMQKIACQEKIGIIMQSLTEELEKLSNDYLVDRENLDEGAEIIFEKLKDFLCARFFTSANEYLRKNPFSDLESLRVFLHSKKAGAIENLLDWLPKTLDNREPYKTSLEEKLDSFWKDIEERHAQIQNERKFQNEMKMKFYKKFEDYLCDEYMSLTAVEISRDPASDPALLQNNLDNFRMEILRKFESEWKPGNEDFQQMRFVVLRDRLDVLKKKSLDERKQFLDEENQRFAKLKEVIPQKCENLLRIISNLKLECIPNWVLFGQIEEIKKYTEDHENFCKREYCKVHKDLLENLTVARNGLFLLEKEIPPRKAVEWVEDVNRHILNSFKLLCSSDDPRNIEIRPAELAEANGLRGYVVDNDEAAVDLSVTAANQGGKRRVQEKVIASSSERPRREPATTSATGTNERKKSAPMSKSTPSGGNKNPHYTKEDDVEILKFALEKYGLPGTEENPEEVFFEGLELQIKGGGKRGNPGLYQRFLRLVTSIEEEGPEFLEKKYRNLFLDGGQWKDWKNSVVELASKARPSPRTTPTSVLRQRTLRGATSTDSTSDLRPRRLFPSGPKNADIKRN